MTASLKILRKLFIPVVICYPSGILIQIKKINKRKYIPYLTSSHGVMELKKVDTGLLQIAFLVGQAFILRYYQIMLKLPFNPIRTYIRVKCTIYHHRTT